MTGIPSELFLIHSFSLFIQLQLEREVSQLQEDAEAVEVRAHRLLMHELRVTSPCTFPFYELAKQASEVQRRANNLCQPHSSS